MHDTRYLTDPDHNFFNFLKVVSSTVKYQLYYLPCSIPKELKNLSFSIKKKLASFKCYDLE